MSGAEASFRKKRRSLQIFEKPFQTGKSKAARQAKTAAAKQQQREDLRLAEATQDVALAEAGALSTRSGRKSLIKSSPSGLSNNLGGT